MKMAEGQSSSQISPVILSFKYRRTGMGAYDDTIIISLRTRRVINSILRTSRTGNHGDRYYKLLPAKYLSFSVTRSNGGHLYAKIAIIKVNDDGSVSTMREWRMDSTRGEVLQLNDFPQEIREMLTANKEELPLFNRVFPFDTQDNEEE